MKKLFYIVLLLVSTYVFSQNKGVTYQAVIYVPGGQNVPGVNVANVPMTNRTICLQFSFLDASSGIEYQEEVKTKTDEFGMVNITIGSGTQTGGYASSFASIVWSAAAEKSLKVALDATGLCSQFDELSVEKLASVPFANAAITAGNVSGVVAIVNGGTGATTAAGARTNLGIGNVENTADLNKPMSTATKIYVDSQIVNSTIPDATTTAKGKLQLAGDLAGTAAAPTVPGLALKANTADVTTSLATKENISNKSTDVTLASNSDVKFPTEKAVKTYVDIQVAGATIADASATNKGKLQLAGDLAGTAANPLVANNAITTAKIANAAITDAKIASGISAAKVGLGNVDNTADLNKPISIATQTELNIKEAVANKSINVTTDAGSDIKYPSVKAIKNYVDTAIAGATIVDADATTKGKLQLAGDLAGTAVAPTVPGLALKENINNKSSDIALDATSTSKYPSVKAIKDYVDALNTAAGVADGSITSAKIANATIVNADVAPTAAIDFTKLNIQKTDVLGLGIVKSDLALGNVDNTSDANKPVSTATQTALGLKANTTDLATEVTRASAAEATLTTNVTANATAITAETTRANTAETTLTTNLATEATTARAAELANATAITTEATTARAAEATLTTNVAANATAITTEATTARAAEATLTTNVTANATAITAETTRATAAETTLNTNLAAEATTARSAELANATAITTEATTARAAEATLTTNVTANATAIALKENAANKSTAVDLGNSTPSDILFPSQAAVKAYVDSSVSSGAPDATASTSGKIQLAGDLTGTAVLPSVAANAITSAKIKDGEIINADVANNAAIAYSKLNLANAIVAADITSDAVTTAKITNANVTYAKIQDVSATDKVLGRVSTGAGVIEEIATTGTGDVVRATLPTLVSPDLGTPTVAVLTNATGLPLTSGVTGTLPVANGGTGLTSLTAGYIPYGNGTNALSSSSNLTWDNTNKLLMGVYIGKGADNTATNLAYGNFSLSSNSGGTYNTGLGIETLKANTTGSYNVAVGYQSLLRNTTGQYNTGSGYFSLINNTTGNKNSAFGMYGLAYNTSSDENSAFGYSALANSTGAYNSAFGSNALATNVAGTKNTAIGAGADVASAGLTNATAIGYGAIAGSSNTVQLGDANITNVNTSGAITSAAGISGTQLTSTITTGIAPFVVTSTTPVANLSIGGNAANVTGTVAIANGGTGATNAADALANLTGTQAANKVFAGPASSITTLAAYDGSSLTGWTNSGGTTIDSVTGNPGSSFMVTGSNQSFYRDLGQSLRNKIIEFDVNITSGVVGFSIGGNGYLGLKIAAGTNSTNGVADQTSWLYPNSSNNTYTFTPGIWYAIKIVTDNGTAGGTTWYVNGALIGNSGGYGMGTGTNFGILTDGGTAYYDNIVIKDNSNAGGAASFRSLVASDIPTLNQNTTGNAANVTGTVAIANGGTGATTAAAALTNLGAEATANKSTAVDLGNSTPSDILFPSQKAVKTYVDSSVSSGAPDATTSTKGKLKLAGDLTGTAALPEIATGAVNSVKILDGTIVVGDLAADAVETAKIKDANVTYAKIQNVSATDKVLGRVSTGAGVVEEIATTGSGNVVRATSPTLVTPVLGAATGTSLSVSGQLTSTVATGTAPLVVTSTTPVANLSIGGNAATATKATNIDGGALGSVPYQSAAGTTSLLAGNTSATAKYLTSTGDGTTAAAPTWTTLTLGSTNLDGLSDAKVEGTNFSGSMILGHQTTGTLSNATVNTAVGIGAMSSITQGDMNVAVGYNALKNVTTGETNNAFGHEALFSTTTGYQNVGIGSTSLYSNTTGYLNTSIGYQSLRYNTTGNSNVGIGSESMLSNTTGNNNSALGSRAMQYSDTGGQNVSLGFESLRWNSAGSSNTGAGYRALLTNVTGNYNTAIGSDADISADGLSNATAVGAMAIVDASNTIQLGNTSVTSVKTTGKLTSGAVTYPNTDGTSGQVLTTNGSGAVSFTSIPSTNLTSGVTGILPVANGGTGLTSITAGQIPFGNGTSALGASSNLFWDNTNGRLGIGTSSPSSTLQIGSESAEHLKYYVDGSTNNTFKLGYRTSGWLMRAGANSGVTTDLNFAFVNNNVATDYLTVGSSGGVTVTGALNVTGTATALSGSFTNLDLANSALHYNGTDNKVGLFTGAPSSKFQIFGDGNGDFPFKYDADGNGGTLSFTFRSKAFKMVTNQNSGVLENLTYYYNDGTTNTQIMQLNNAGQVRIPALLLPTGAAAGKYLTSDTNGLASWSSLSTASASASGLLSSADWTTFNGKQAAYSNLTTIGSLSNGAGYLKNTGTGTFTYANPAVSEITGLGTGVATALATPSSANVLAAVTDETGTGALVFATSPTLVTPVLGVATATSVNKVTITAPTTSATLTIADGKTLTASNDATVSGTNTGDQTITLTGDVTGTGTGSFATTIGTAKVTNAMLAGSIDLTAKVTGALPIANGGTGATTKAAAFDALSPMTTAGDIIYGGTSGTGTRLAKGTDGQVLTLASGAPSWATPAGVTTMAAIGSTPNANGATISGTTLNLQPASSSFGGVVTTGTQTFTGAKTFTTTEITANAGSGSSTPGSAKGLVISPSLKSGGIWTELVGVDIIPTLNVNGNIGSANPVGLRVQGANIIATGAGNDPTNTAIGQYSLIKNTGTSNGANTGVGYFSLGSNTSGTSNTAFGSNTLMYSATGNSNTAIGESALRYNTVNNNTAIGSSALVNAVSATENIAIGKDAGSHYGPVFGNGYTAPSGTRNILIGTDVRPLTNTDSYEIVIGSTTSGSGTIGDGSNTTTIGAPNTTSVKLYGPIWRNHEAIAPTNFAAKDLTIKAQDANIVGYSGGADNPGGNIVLTPGSATGTGVAGIVQVNGQLKITGGTPGAGKVLTSDAAGLATWSNGGGTIATLSATGNASSTASYVIFTGSTASQIITVPSASTVGAGKEITIKNVASVSVSIASASGNLIQDNSTLSATTAALGIEPSNNWMKLVSDGTNWYIFRALF